MLLKQATLAGIADGRITLAFRRWKRPTVKAGGTLLTSIGQLAIDTVDVVERPDITAADAAAAGFADRDALLAMLDRREGGAIHRVALRLAGPDPRIALRDSVPDAEEVATITARLERWDRSSPTGPWTRRTLELIRDRPACYSGDLAAELGADKPRFKARVRKLKGLGLTESLKVGYRISARGEGVLERWPGGGVG